MHNERTYRQLNPHVRRSDGMQRARKRNYYRPEVQRETAAHWLFRAYRCVRAVVARCWMALQSLRHVQGDEWSVNLATLTPEEFEAGV